MINDDSVADFLFILMYMDSGDDYPFAAAELIKAIDAYARYKGVSVWDFYDEIMPHIKLALA